jgi:1,2-phenylacetyl-CoA epoxidase PaaB subunit
MPKKPTKQYRWSIYRIKGTPAAFLGTVEAPDEDGAIKKAIENFEIRELEKQNRLVARRHGH